MDIGRIMPSNHKQPNLHDTIMTQYKAYHSKRGYAGQFGQHTPCARGYFAMAKYAALK
jgi:hypothetical protein